MRKNILNKFFIITFLSTSIIVLIAIYQFRDIGIQTSLEKARVISELVKKSLTAHMINDNMDQKKTFLNSIVSVENINKLWIVRSDLVNKQFNTTDNKLNPRDQIDKKVLTSGKMHYELDETIENPTIRVTIPYNAKSDQTIDCLKCHKVKYGDTLGAISIELDISKTQIAGVKTIVLALIILLILFIIVIPIINRVMKKYFDTIDTIISGFNSMTQGDFTTIEPPKNITPETQNIIDKYNNLNNKLNTTFNDIDNKLKVFIGNNTISEHNILDNANEIITKLSLIYQFKKEIELDDTKDEIYERLSQVFINQFNLDYFTIMEMNSKEKQTNIVYQHGDKFFCSKSIMSDPSLCRVSRNSNDVISTKFHKACSYFTNDDYLYYCVDIEAGKGIKIIVNFVLKDKNELNELKQNIPFVKSYISEAAPAVEVHFLLKKLQESAFKDGLTGLYNRKFLDEHLKKLLPQAKREKINIGVLLLDMDHFKAVNDEYGHDIGDKVLKELSGILTNTLRESDIIVRYGGEEFLILLVGVNDEQSAMEVADKIRSNVAANEISVYAGNTLKKTVSIGLSMYPSDSTIFDNIVKYADIALYQAKESGRDQVVRFNEDLISSVDIF